VLAKRLYIEFYLVLIVVFCFFVACDTASSAAPELLNTENITKVSKGISQEVFPNSDFVIVDEHITKVYQADGTYRVWDEQYVKILTESGKRQHQTVSQYFTLPYGIAEIKLLEVIKPDGSVIGIDVAANSREMVNPSQMSANIYNPNSKILKVGVPGLEIGDMLHMFSFDDIVKARVPNTWSDYNVFEYTAPIVHIVLDVNGPTALPLVNIRLYDEVVGTVVHTLNTIGDRNHYRWEVKNVPRMFSEPKMPSLYTVVQRLLVSTIPDWESISRWYWELSKAHLEDVTPEMKAKVAELINGVDDRDEKIKRIFRFVSQQIRYMGITTEKTAPGYEPHDASLTFNNRYGVCRDKAALLAAMLRLADLPGYPVLINSGPRKDEDVPQPYFNHAIVAVGNDDGSYMLMDPTDENSADLFPAYLSYMSYLVAHPDGETLRTSPVVPASENMLNIKTTGNLSADGRLSLISDLNFGGINDNAYRSALTKMKPEERRRFFEGQLKKIIAGSKLTGFSIRPIDMQDITEPLSVTLEYTAVDYPVVGDEHTLLSAPWLGTGFGYANWLLGGTGLDQRKYPYYIRLTAGVQESIEIEMDAANGCSTSEPDSVILDAEGISYSQSVGVISNDLSASAIFMIDSVQFSPKEYIDLKQLLKDREYEQRKKVVVKHSAPKELENNIRVLSDESEIDLKDIANWTVTRTLQKKILTYAGKKENSELKIGFNPAWESIRLVSATVENSDGSLHKVVDNEMNLMDSSWVGGAPRYPPSRMLVVSLPGVEEGSLITYQIERKVFGKPFFSIIKTFQGDDPVDSASIIIKAPVDLTLHILDLTGDSEYAVVTNSAIIKHTWKIGPQTAIKPEENLPPKWSFLSSLFVSSGDLECFSAEVGTYLERATVGQSQSSLKAIELVKGRPTERERILVLRNFIARSIRSAGPSMSSLPLSSISMADTVLEDGYGNTTDKAVLFATMLRAVGIKGEFVMASSWSPKTDSLRDTLLAMPHDGLFDYLLVKVDVEGEVLYLSANDQYAELGCTKFDGRIGLDMAGKVFLIDVAENMKDRSQVEFNLVVSENGDAKIRVKRSYYGMEFGHKKRIYTEFPPEERRRHFMELITSLSQAAKASGDLITQFDVYPGTREFSVDIPRYSVRSGKYLYITLPLGMPSPMRLKSDNREQPLYRKSPLRNRVIYDIQLPENTKDVVLLPPDIDWEGPSGLGNVEFSKDVDGETGHVLLTQRVDFKPAVIRPETYPMLLDLGRKLKHPGTRTIMVELEE